MKWGKKHKKKKKTTKDEEEEEEEEEACKEPASSSSSSRFFLSRVLPFSWISKLTQSNKPSSQSTVPDPTPKPKHNSNAAHARRPTSANFSVTPDVLERIAARCPPEPHDAPRRLSLGDDETSLARARASHTRAAVSRSARHNSLGELELRPLHSSVGAEPQQRFPRAWPAVLHSPSETEQSEFEPSVPRRRPPPRRRRQKRAGIRANGEASEETETSPPRLSGARKSFRMRSRPKCKACSPRLAAIRRREEGLERFAVVKRTRDPQKEFRESMEEMIGEKGMVGRPEELESLLACYLALNSDEHHDVIVKVFRQVWFDLDRQRFDPKCPSCRRFD